MFHFEAKSGCPIVASIIDKKHYPTGSSGYLRWMEALSAIDDSLAGYLLKCALIRRVYWSGEGAHEEQGPKDGATEIDANTSAATLTMCATLNFKYFK